MSRTSGRGATWIGVQNRNFSEIFNAELVHSIRYIRKIFQNTKKYISDRHVMSDSESESEMHQLLDDWDEWDAN